MGDKIEGDPFGRLDAVSLRDAWRHEAHDFTPWLAANLDRLGEALRMRLDLISEEVKLPTTDDTFSADILARDLLNDTNVLIENQLEGSDHTHLGQILTYLAGLEARTVIWVARSFRDSHLAAIKWLNENTREEFAFFAVVVRVVRIGDSPMAPLFDIVEKPNSWERRAQSASRSVVANSANAALRQRFWDRFLERHPDFEGDSFAAQNFTRWRACSGGRVVVGYYLAKGEVGVFVRGPRKATSEETGLLLAPISRQLEAELGVDFGPGRTGHFLGDTLVCDYSDDEAFDGIAEWIVARVPRYAEAIDRLMAANDM